jgi:two-component system chemotaxis sensor kinase CheA
MGEKMFNTIARKIGVGYLTVVLVLIMSGLFISWETEQLVKVNKNIRNIRTPALEASYKLLNGINESQSMIRGWIILGEQRYYDNYKLAWEEDINSSLGSLEALSPNFVRPEAVTYLNDIRKMIKDLKLSHEAIEKTQIARTKIPENIQKRLAAPELRKKIEDFVDFQHKLMSEEAQGQTDLISQINNMELALIIIGIATCFSMALIVIRLVTRPINNTIEFANKIAGGNYEGRIEIRGTVEIDRLRVALEQMRTHLEKQSWLNKAQLHFNEAIRGVNTVGELAQSAMSSLARFIRADVGLLYLQENEKLKVAGGYSYPKNLSPETEISLGEGLAGQAAMEQRIISLNNPTEEQLSINTMLGDVRPREILAAPLVYKNEVIGVFELASLNKIRAWDQELLSKVSQTMAISLDSAIKSDQVRNLLHETQTQSEELQAQQEELRQINDELQSRQEELESINEELEEQQSALKEQKNLIDEKNKAYEIAQKELLARTQELEKIGQYKSEFLANMSHELRTPLNSQLILSKLLIENKDGNLTPKQIQFAQTIHGTGLDLLKLINDILDLSKVEAGKLNLEIEKVKIKNVIENLQRDFSAMAEQKGLKFKAQVDADVPEFMSTDSHRLGQILRNLISNAIKFTEQGEIRLQVGRSSIPAEKGQIIFKVIDSGIGIPDDKQEVIFQAFEQVDSATTRKYGGTGLGLAISRQLAKLLGGEIYLESQLGKGSTFSLKVPETFETQSHTQSLSAMAAPKPSGKTEVPARNIKPSNILIIDRDPAVQKQISDLLKKDAVDAVCVTNAESALKEFRLGKNYVCVVLDLNIPDTDGFELLRTLKREDPSVPVVIYSSRELKRLEEEDLRKATEAIVIKGPNSIDRLMDEISLLMYNSAGESPKEKASDGIVKKEKIFNGQTILLVDDDVRNIFSLTSALEDRGLNVLIARDGKEALGVLEQNSNISLVLMDIMMPVMDGYEATRLIKSSSKFSKIPVLALTAKAMKEDKELCLAAGANDYLPKPVDLDRLYTILSVWLTK